jgi:lambda family phage portal protein
MKARNANTGFGRDAERPLPPPNFIDRFVSYFDPAAGLRRQLARRAIENIRGYDGAAKGRRTDGWRAGNTSADTEIAGSGSLLRDRMRDLVRNNPHSAKAVTVLVNNLIGSGIRPRAATKSASLNQRANELFERWSTRSDANGLTDFYGLQTLAAREMIEGGDVFIRNRPRRRSDSLPVPFQLQLLEADHLDTFKLGTGTGGGRIIRGIEYDGIGRRVAYWLFPDHPGDLQLPTPRTFTSQRVGADFVTHMFERLRVQQSGVPWGAPVMRALRDLDDWTNSELTRKKTEACLVGVVIGGDDADQGIAPSVIDSDGKPVEQFEPGLIAYARGGKDIKFNQPASTAGVSEWLKAQLRIVAAGFRMPYELMTGDLSEVNYTSHRAGLVEFRRMITAMQWQIVIPMMCQPTWDWFTDYAYQNGLLPDPVIPVEWDPPGFDAVDPLKDAQADLVAIRSGTKTLLQAIAAKGYDPKRHIEEIAQSNALLDANGIVLDSDPRTITKAGTLQPDASQPASDGSGDPPADKAGDKPVAGQ